MLKFAVTGCNFIINEWFDLFNLRLESVHEGTQSNCGVIVIQLSLSFDKISEMYINTCKVSKATTDIPLKFKIYLKDYKHTYNNIKNNKLHNKKVP